MRKSYLMTQDYKMPVVLEGQQAHRPAQVRFKTLRKGQVVVGELKHVNNQPACILVGRTGAIPLNFVQEINTSPIATATETKTETQSSAEGKVKEFISPSNPKVKYGDAMIIGALVGFIGVHVAQKYEYLPADEKKYKLFGALAGGLLGVYLVYRTKYSTPTKVQTTKKEE